jgi:predicted Zn-dependent protease
MMRGFAIAAAALILVVFSMPATAQTPGCGTPAASNESSPDARSQQLPRAVEIALGRKASVQYETTIQLLCDDTVHAYVNRIAQTVAGGSNVRVPITIKVVDSSEINALSFPGGFLYINSGLILAVESEAEIASVVAHEIAHVVARDGMRGQSLAQNPVLNTAATPTDGENKMGQIDGYLIPLNNLGGRRETEADYNGIRYMQKSGYSPRAMITFLQRMLSKEQTDPKSVVRLFQNHPPTAERIRGIGERIGYPSATQTPPDAELQSIKRIITDRSRLQQYPSTSH